MVGSTGLQPGSVSPPGTPARDTGPDRPDRRDTRHELMARWQALKSDEPGLRTRDAAARLGVSEAELVHTRTDVEVHRLDGPWDRLVASIFGLGPVMALTRNNHAVHEKVGQFEQVQVLSCTGQVQGDGMQLRLFFPHWHFGFAITEAFQKRTRCSLQFFDSAGTAVHKVYLRRRSDEHAFRELVSEYRHPDRWQRLAVTDDAAIRNERPHDDTERSNPHNQRLPRDGTRDVADTPQGWTIGRIQQLRALPEHSARRIRDDGFQVALEHAAEAGIPVKLLVGNGGALQSHTGPVRRLKQVGPWFNVLDPDFSLHLRSDGIACAWALQEQTCNSIVTSVEIFAAAGQRIASLKGQRNPGEEETSEWRALAASLSNYPRV